jgi:homoserine kinase type II
MLWESVDAAEALTKRFGFASAASAADWAGDALWDGWAIAVDHCDRLVISAGNVLAWVTADDRPLIAKWSAFPWLFRRLADTATLTIWLQASGIPVAAPIPARDGRLRLELRNISLGVYPVVDGDLLDVDDPTQVADLEEVTYDTRVADLAKATVLLGTRYRNWGPTSQDVREAFVAAYHDEAPLTSTEQNELGRRTTAIERHFGW